MSRLLKTIINAAIVTTLLTMAGLAVNNVQPLLIDRISIFVLLPSYFLITTLSLIVFYAGESKPADTQYLFTLSSIGIKFFLSAVLALIYFAVFKKSEVNFVLLFFILYLTFTFYLIMVIVKVLKTRSL